MLRLDGEHTLVSGASWERALYYIVRDGVPQRQACKFGAKRARLAERECEGLEVSVKTTSYVAQQLGGEFLAAAIKRVTACPLEGPHSPQVVSNVCDCLQAVEVS